MSSAICNNFRPHQVRPDKCRNCFGEKSRHESNSNNKEDEQQADLDRKTGEELRQCREDKGKLAAELAALKAASGDEWRRRCEVAEEERDLAINELKQLQHEMEEMHDNFKEEESEQFEQLKQELDIATKNCKILQIRLNKSERQYNQLEQVKSAIERQLEDQQKVSANVEAIESVGVNHQQQPFVQVGADWVKVATDEYDQLLRDLNDTIEREKDLQEQAKYSQEEAQLKGERLLAVEAENEVLTSKVNKLTTANSKLRLTGGSFDSSQSSDQQLLEQTEQLKLALEVAQAESQRLRARCDELAKGLESSQRQLKECEATKSEFEEAKRWSGDGQLQSSSQEVGPRQARLELECRQLRAKLVRCEREMKQLRGELELARSQPSGRARANSRPHLNSQTKSQSMELEESQLTSQRQLRDECDLLREQRAQLERRLAEFEARNVGQTAMESDLVEKLKRELETSESELARAKSRLVELEVESNRVQRQYRRLLEFLEPSKSQGEVQGRRMRTRLPPESVRESMGRQELRQMVKDLEEEMEELLGVIRAKDCLLADRSNSEDSTSNCTPAEEQAKSLRRLLDQERLLSNNLKLDVARLETARAELLTERRMLERERVAMEEEVEKMRQVNVEQVGQLEEARKTQRALGARLKDLQVAYERVRVTAVDQSSMASENHEIQQQPVDALLLARDLSELKVKNNFLMRQLEVSREDTLRQLEEQSKAQESHLRRQVELAQIELKERHLAESQQLRDELAELRQRLATSQRSLTRAEEETQAERERIRSIERDWRREKGQWQQRLEQLEAQLGLERRSAELKAKEMEAAGRERERQALGVQDRCVQLERDLKRLQNKYQLLEENSESQQRSLVRELESKRSELAELMASSRSREEEFHENCKRFNQERATLLEAFEATKRSYDERLSELKTLKESLQARQDRSFKERQQFQERLDDLGGQLVRLSDCEAQAKLAKQQLQASERQVESLRRELAQLKEDKLRVKTRAEELERRCQGYEKLELIAKTTSISSGGSFLKTRMFSPSTSSPPPSVAANRRPAEVHVQTNSTEQCDQQQQLVERLSSKVNDQRHLTRLLRQQNEELQAEVRQLRLSAGAERIKWQAQVAQLSGRVNECEERLLFEASLSNDTFEVARRRQESKWASERQQSLETIQQQAQHAEQLMRDLRKLGQAHDLLRLQSKQLESHNGKLSRRLIEYQQTSGIGGGNSSKELEACLEERQALEARLEQLGRQNQRLGVLLRDEAKPLVELVGKLVDRLEANERAKAAVESKSTKRPLVTDGRQPSDELSGTEASLMATKINASSRLSRILGGKKTVVGDTTTAADVASPTKTLDEQTGSAKKKALVKRARPKWATPSEKQQLRCHLEELGAALEQLDQSAKKVEASPPPPRQQVRSTSEAPSEGSAVDVRPFGGPRHHSTSRAVHWQTDTSDLDSNSNWSVVEPTNSNSKPMQRPAVDLYRRFPAALPALGKRGGGASLTDYESESSLASDLPATLSARTTTASAESDGGVAVSGVRARAASGKRRGLRTRLTSTLRSISRSISALATSDSELERDESLAPSSRRLTDRGKLKEVRV